METPKEYTIRLKEGDILNLNIGNKERISFILEKNNNLKYFDDKSSFIKRVELQLLLDIFNNDENLREYIEELIDERS